MEKEVGYFEKFFGAAQEIIDLAKKPLIRSQQKRRFRSAYDDAANRMLDATAEIEKLRENIKDIKIDHILEKRKYINQCKLMQDFVKEEYLLAFGKEMKIAEDED